MNGRMKERLARLEEAMERQESAGDGQLRIVEPLGGSTFLMNGRVYDHGQIADIARREGAPVLVVDLW